MNNINKNVNRILIVDDSEINRSILADILNNEFELIEAKNGTEAVEVLKEQSSEICLVLLDVLMDDMDGFEVLEVMNRNQWIKKVPVIMISAENSPSYVNRAFELGAIDYISRPFNEIVVRRRVLNTIMLYAKQRQFNSIITDQSSKNEKNNIVKDITASNRTLTLLEKERIKYKFFASMSSEIQFEYTINPSMLSISDFASEFLNLPNVITDIKNDARIQEIISYDDLKKLDLSLKASSPDEPIVEYKAKLNINGSRYTYKFICRSMWSNEEEEKYIGAIGKAVDIDKETQEIDRLKKMASLDSLTKLLNKKSAEKKISELLKNNPEQEYCMLFFDIDFFKLVNDRNGHLFGDGVLKFIADRAKSLADKEDIVARAGGDEFLIFIKDCDDTKERIEHIFKGLRSTYNNVQINISMGIAKTENTGRSYKELYIASDTALYAAKQNGRNNYSYYDKNMIIDNAYSSISKIDIQE